MYNKKETSSKPAFDGQDTWRRELKDMYICVDVGGTAIKYGLVDGTGGFTSRGSIPSEAKRYGGPGIVRKVRHIIAAAAVSETLEGIAISTAGIVDAEEGRVRYAMAESIPAYTGTAWRERLTREFHLPCAVENDVNCAALGEMWLGAGRGCTSLFCMTVGTSIGGCAVYNGRIIRGAADSAGEIAYMRIPGGRMHELVSAARLIRDVAQARGMREENLDGPTVFEWAAKGDAAAQQALCTLTEHLADGISNVIAVLNPQAVILGGGIMAQERLLRPLLEKALRERLIPDVYQHTKIAFAALRNDAGMLGALYHLQQQMIQAGRSVR